MQKETYFEEKDSAKLERSFPLRLGMFLKPQKIATVEENCLLNRDH